MRRVKLLKLWAVAFIAACSAIGASPWAAAQSTALSKTEFEIIEGIFHDGLGTHAEVTLANEVIGLARLSQPLLDTSRSTAKMRNAINRLPESHPSRAIFQREITNVEAAARRGARELIESLRPAAVIRVLHVPREYAEGKAGDLRLECSGRPPLPVSVKTDKSRKVAVAEGQTPDIGPKWAERYFRVSPAELEGMVRELGYSSMSELRSHYLNVARLVALVLIRKLGLINSEPADFSRARVADVAPVKYLFHQLLLFKRGNDSSRVIIFDRSTGEVKWESLLDGIDVDGLTGDRVSFLPSRPRGGHPIASEFGVKVDGRTIVSFQVKHRRGRSRGTPRQYEFSDITTRLRV
ncbi:MAG TPA: hypothetical protein VJH03_01885 [Blastocatellia bacterium]|nr:hypothetical protein [Blastocatellia bacterium]